MKKFFTTALLGAMCVLGASAQSMTIYAPDGTYTKYNTDYVQEVTFQEVTAQEAVALTGVKVQSYSKGTADIEFTAEGVSVCLYVCGPEDALYLNSGVYELSAANTPMTFDSAPNYSWVTLNGTKLGIQAGKMIVSNTGNDYTITLDFTLSDATPFKAVYHGELPGYGPLYNVPAVGCRVIPINGQVPGEFCLRFNDVDWKYELTIDFFCDADATTLTPGTYTYSETPGPGNFGPHSSIDMFKPNYTSKVRGTATVALEGKDYVITLDLENVDGRKYLINYKGEIDFDTDK
ncbi:MAG: hypothetical protein K2O24_01285 [Muribaculaceae bacterium]|nr:hypothetical protein [Muribaculaceae bacterium]